MAATAITGPIKNQTQVECSLATLQCTFAGVLNPYEQIAVTINVKVEEPPGTTTTLADEASVEGGGAAPASRTLGVPVGPVPAPFGVTSYELGPFNEDGTPATQAGAHPFQLTTTFALNQTAARHPVQLPKDLGFHLPPGLVGNPNVATQCSMANFFALVLETNLCPPSSVVGVATVIAHEPLANVITKTVPVFNLVPAQGEPARFGFEVIGKIPVVIDTSVRSGGDYGVDVTVKDATETAGLLSQSGHASGECRVIRGMTALVAGNASPAARSATRSGSRVPPRANWSRRPFLTSPTSCSADPASEPVASSVDADSWPEPGSFVGAGYEWMSATGERLGLHGLRGAPILAVGRGDARTSMRRARRPGCRWTCASRSRRCSNRKGWPRRMCAGRRSRCPPAWSFRPRLRMGSSACSEAQVGFEGFDPASHMQRFSTEEAACPDASKLGVVHIKTPLLAPSNSKARCIWRIRRRTGKPAGTRSGRSWRSTSSPKDPVSGVLVKLAGEGQLDEQTLRVATTFRDTPQVPFEDLKVDLFGGPRASVSTPARCGASVSEGVFTPWSGTDAAERELPVRGELGCGRWAMSGGRRAAVRPWRSPRSARTPRPVRSRASSSN